MLAIPAPPCSDPAEVEQVGAQKRPEDAGCEGDRGREIPHEKKTARRRRERRHERRERDPDVRHRAGEPEAERGVDRHGAGGQREGCRSVLRDSRQLVDDDHARDDASADIDRDDRRGGLAEPLGEEAPGAVKPERRRIDRHDPGDSLEGNIEEPSGEHRDHDREREARAQAELGEGRRHRVSEEDGEKNRKRDDQQNRQASERHDSKHGKISPLKDPTPRGVPGGVGFRSCPIRFDRSVGLWAQLSPRRSRSGSIFGSRPRNFL